MTQAKIDLKTARAAICRHAEALSAELNYLTAQEPTPELKQACKVMQHAIVDLITELRTSSEV